MKRNTILNCICCLILLTTGCNKTGSKETGTDEPAAQAFVRGADISWVTEMESRGYKFYSRDGKQTECTELFQELGFNAVRYRVWVNPADGWCNKEDVLVKAKRASSLGMKIMIDFHYSDWWADPGKQNVPAAWKGLDVSGMAAALASHTEEVLSLLKQSGIDVAWVQVGNEVTNGMLWESGRVKDQEARNFVKYFNAGSAAVKSVYPNAKVILHIDGGERTQTIQWFFDLMQKAGASYDIIGFSLYPSYWDSSISAYPDWRPKTEQFVSNLSMTHTMYSKPIMLCEFGMPASEPEASRDALQYIIDNIDGYPWFLGIFLWEPESEHSRNGYDYGAFAGGRPTVALEPFKTLQTND